MQTSLVVVVLVVVVVVVVAVFLTMVVVVVVVVVLDTFRLCLWCVRGTVVSVSLCSVSATGLCAIAPRANCSRRAATVREAPMTQTSFNPLPTQLDDGLSHATFFCAEW